MDIKDGKIWIQEDVTDVPIAQRLPDAEVRKSDIVLGFHAPYKRALAGFAAAWLDAGKQRLGKTYSLGLLDFILNGIAY